MSQYPSPQPPYPSPPGYYNPYQQAAGNTGAPARRASILMIVVGVVMLLFGGCMGMLAKILPTADLPAEQKAQFEQLRAQLPPGVTLEFMLLVAAAVMAVCAIAFIVLGVLVRGGSKGWLITSIVVTALVLIYMAINAIGSVIGPAANPAGLCVAVPMVAVFVLLMVWLLQALKAGRAVSPAEAAMQQYQAQMWYYQQSQQQGYPAPGQYPVPPNASSPGGYYPPPPPPPQQPQGYGYGQQPAPPEQQQQSPQLPQPPQQQWKDPNAPPPEG